MRLQKPSVFAGYIRLVLDHFQVTVVRAVEDLGLQDIAQVAARISLLQLAEADSMHHHK